MGENKENHVIVAYTALSNNQREKVNTLHSKLLAVGKKVRRFGLTRNSIPVDFGNNLSHPKLDKKNNMKVGIGKYSCVRFPKDQQIQPLCRSHLKNNYSLCLYGNTKNLSKFAQEIMIKNHTVFSYQPSRAEIFIHLIVLSNEDSIEEKVISVLKEISGNYNLALTIDDKYLFIARKGTFSTPFYIERLPEDKGFLCSTNINCLREKNIIQIVAPNVLIKFTAGNNLYKKIKLL